MSVSKNKLHPHDLKRHQKVTNGEQSEPSLNELTQRNYFQLQAALLQLVSVCCMTKLQNHAPLRTLNPILPQLCSNKKGTSMFLYRKQERMIQVVLSQTVSLHLAETLTLKKGRSFASPKGCLF